MPLCRAPAEPVPDAPVLRGQREGLVVEPVEHQEQAARGDAAAHEREHRPLHVVHHLVQGLDADHELERRRRGATGAQGVECVECVELLEPAIDEAQARPSAVARPSPREHRLRVVDADDPDAGESREERLLDQPGADAEIEQAVAVAPALRDERDEEGDLRPAVRIRAQRVLRIPPPGEAFVVPRIAHRCSRVRWCTVNAFRRSG